MGEVIPMRLDIEADGMRLRDTFLWHTTDHKRLSVRDFSAALVAEHGLPSSFTPKVVEAVQQQIDNHVNVVPYLRSCGKTESVLTITLSVRVGRRLLRDRFEWDALSNHITPELFAKHMAADLRLPSAFVPLVAHSMREQIDEHLKNKAHAVVTGTEKKRKRDDLAPAIREDDEAELWGPVVSDLDDDGIEKLEQSQEREMRLRRRQSESALLREAVRASLR